MSLLQKFAHLQIPLEDILSATNNFSDENFIREGGFGRIYKGQLFRSGKTIDIVARRLDPKYGQGNKEFFTEISLLYRLKHPNIVSFIGFCDENEEKIIVNKYEAKSSLDKYLSDKTLRWTQRLKICVGVARALSFIYYDAGRDFSIIHRNIKSSKILLDEKWEPKLSGYELSMKNPASRRQRFLLTQLSGTYGYVDPTYKATGTVTHKSDVFSFGVVLFEVLCGRRAIFLGEYVESSLLFTMKTLEHFNVGEDLLLSEIAKSHYEEGKLEDIIDPDLRKQMDQESYEIFSKTAYCCLNKERAQRPDIDQVLTALEKALGLQYDYDHKRSIDVAEIEEDASFNRGKAAPWNLDNTIIFTRTAAAWNSDDTIIFNRDCVPRQRPIEPRENDAAAWNSDDTIIFNRTHVPRQRPIGPREDEAAAWNSDDTIIFNRARVPRQRPIEPREDETAAWSLDVTKIFNRKHVPVQRPIEPRKSRAPAWISGVRKIFHRKRAPFQLPIEPPPEVQANTWNSDDTIIFTRERVPFQRPIDPRGDKAAPWNLDDTIIFTRAHVPFQRPIEPRVNEATAWNSNDTIIFNREAAAWSSEVTRIFNIQRVPFQRPIEPRKVGQANGDIMSFSLHDFAHLQIPLEDISLATNNFADKNIIGLGRAGKLYKGRLTWYGKEIEIVARRIEGVYWQGQIELWTEISMLSSLRHENLVSVVGFCDEDGKKFIIYEHVGYGCLDQHLGDPALTWSQTLQICLGVARALKTIHYDFIQCGISSSTVLLDAAWKAKVFGFGISTRYPGNWEHRLLLTHYNDVSANTPPISVTPKYDVYTFGVLLYDVLCRGKPTSTKDYGVKGKLDEMIDPDLRKQMDTQSFTNLSKLADNCLNQESMQRPSMDQIVTELENMLKSEMKPEEDLEHSTLAAQGEAVSSDILTDERLECLKIPISDIKSATDNFNQVQCIGSGGFGTVFKAELDHILLDQKKNNELQKKRSTVAIKRISNQDGEEGFLAEIKMLTSCSHPNIVSLLGFSKEESEMVLVFEFALKGSLDSYLENNKMANVTWAQRILICLDVARGIQYLHTNLEGKRMILHRDVKSANILLDEKWNAKVADFGLSKINPVGHSMNSALVTKHIVGTEVYLDPEYLSKGIYAKASDIYSFGVVLFEILCGRLAYDPIYNVGNDKGLATVARQHFKNGTIKELIDFNMMEEANEHIFTINKEPNHKSLDAFTKIAYQCLEESQVMRPKMETIIKELEDALKFQGKSLLLMKFRLSDIVSATSNFSAKYCIGVSAHGKMYNAELDHFYGKALSELVGKNGVDLPKRSSKLCLKHMVHKEGTRGQQGFFAEIETLSSFKHPNIVSHLGVASENHEIILVYENSFEGSLHDYIGSHKMANLTWAKRIQISLDIAEGLSYLQTSTWDKERVMQFDINSANILLDAERRAKIACFWLSRLVSVNIDDIVAREVRWDPEYIKIERLKRESSIYSFGVILFEILCGRLGYDNIYYAGNEKGLPNIARRRFDEGTLLKEMMDTSLKKETDEKTFRLNEEVNQDSLNAFSKIAYQCCAETGAGRPSMDDIIKELKNALKIQEEHSEHFKTRAVKKLENETPLIALTDILLATKKFSKDYLIGAGGFCMVYRAELGHLDAIAMGGKNKDDLLKRHRIVALKRFTKGDEQGAKGFFTELETLSICKHHNIVSLLGFCFEKDEMILVLEYASKGSLGDILRKATSLTWAQRIQICLDVARGLSYLHNGIKGKQLIHMDIKSANILLNENWVAKIADFGLCKLNDAHLNGMNTNIIAGTKMYLDPEYMKTGWLNEKSDIYSFGVVLFEILCGKTANDKTFKEGGLPPIARKCVEDGKLKQIVDTRMSTDDENTFMLNGGLNQDSLETFSNIAYQCLEETQVKRPTIQAVIIELEKAYYFQKNSKDKLQISLEDIQVMTGHFSDNKCIGEGRYWKQYEGEMAQANEYITVVAKRFDKKSKKQRYYFFKELEILSDCKNENIIGLEGYCQDKDEAIIIYKHASNGRLNEHLDDASVTWMKRLKICIDVACGLHFLHTNGGVKKDIWMMHTDIKSASILLDREWRAKISNLESCLYMGEHKEVEDVADNAYGSLGYLDPEYKQSGYFTHKSDIYSLGVVLLEILCGRLAWEEGCEDHSQSLGPLAKRCFEVGKLDELVFDGIKKQIDQESLTAFGDIALKCLKDERGQRPEASEVVTHLRKALEIYENSDPFYEPKLPGDYEEIIRFIKPDDNTKEKKKTKKDIYDMLIKGVLLRDREVCLSLGSNGVKHYMLSAKKFSYKNRWAVNWQHIPQSRFEYVAKMLTWRKLDLNIKCKIKTRFLSPGINYGVHLVFKFGGPRKISAKSMYVNLTYKMGTETFHAYFATWRDKDWMTIEFCRFLNQKEDHYFEVLLESFSLYYCGKGAVYVEGIEFRVIDNVRHKEIEKIKEVQQVQQWHSGSDAILRKSEDDANKLFSLNNERNKKMQFMLSAKEVLYDSSNVKHFHVVPSMEYRSQEVIELLPQLPVLRMSCKIQSKMLSQDTSYSCYLVFKLSEKCRGLHCPVKVRDLHCRKKKEDKNVYFRSPSPWNSHDFNQIPERREDGWMEVNVWNFNSKHKLQYDFFWVNLKLISYEGTMAGLIVCGLEFRPI